MLQFNWQNSQVNNEQAALMKKPLNTIESYRRSIMVGIVGGLALAGMFFGGYITHDLISTAENSVTASSTIEFPLLEEVQRLLDLHYLRSQPDWTARQYAAIRGLLSALNDRYTFFIEPPVAQSESDVLAGTYGGIGVLVQRDGQGKFVLYPFEDGPAFKAGIQDGELLEKINGAVLDPQTPLDTVDQMLRGEVKAGNGVEITVSNPDSGTRTLFLLFEVINVPSVIWRVATESPAVIGYVQILRFTSRTPDETKAALEGLDKFNVQGLILDLRNNNGGLLQESIAVAGQFVGGHVIVYEKISEGERAITAPNANVLIPDVPLAVLVNSGTASAAELVAGAIRDNGRGILIGQATYGKGTVQQIFRLSDGSSIHITSAEWFTPKKYPLDGVGLQPDIAMIPDAAGSDIELVEAIRYLTRERHTDK